MFSWANYRISLFLLVAQLVLVINGWAADTLLWRTNSALVSADIRDAKLSWLLQEITTTTRWSVFVEPDVSHVVSAKFKDLPPGEALRLLLGDLNFALIPEANAPPRLFVFRTTMGSATQQVHVPTPPRTRGPEPDSPGRTRRRERPEPPGGSTRPVGPG
jgi:hypothetical protein